MGPNTPVVTRVPYEIVRDIIRHAYAYIPKTPESTQSESTTQLVSPPIVASHVCRSWRQSLLSDPQMWTCILFPQMKPTAIIEMLRRSGSAPLCVFLGLEQMDGSTSQMLTFLFEQFHRFELLHMHIGYDHFGFYTDEFAFGVQYVLGCLGQSAPRLRTFGLWHSDVYPLRGSFLNTLQAPNLSLLHIPFFNKKRLHRSLFQDVSELHLTLFEPDIQLVGLIRVLQTMPRLKVLGVYGDLEDELTDTDPFSELEVALPHLDKLVLEVNNAVELPDYILDHVTFPQNIKWRIFSHWHSDRRDLSSSLQRLVSPVSFTSLHITFFSGRLTDVVVSFGKTNNVVANDDHKLVYIHRGSRDLEDSLDDDPPSAVHSILSTSSITHLNLHFQSYEYGKELYPKLFALVPNLVSMTIKSETPMEKPSAPDTSWLVELYLKYHPESGKSNGDAVAKAPEKSSESEDPEDPDSYEYCLSAETESTLALPCPSLRELTLDIMYPLDKPHASRICKLSDKRREKGLPLQIFVRCPKIEDDAEAVLQSEGAGNIHVSVIPAK